jgi:hypothetical protein
MIIIKMTESDETKETRRALSIAAISLIAASFVLVATYKVGGGRNAKSKILGNTGEFGKFVFYIGVLLLAIATLIEDTE